MYRGSETQLQLTEKIDGMALGLYSRKLLIAPFLVELINYFCYPRGIVPRHRDLQLRVSKIINNNFLNLIPNICKMVMFKHAPPPLTAGGAERPPPGRSSN